jgi:ribosomal protein S18 acetylase RimI-like enzyme
MAAFQIRPLNQADRAWVTRFLEGHWGSASIVSRGRLHQADRLPGFVAVRDGEMVGLVTYQIQSSECEIVSLDSLVEGVGIGSALIEAVEEVAIAADCKRLWLVTTNDNTHALRFYQRRGFVLAALHRNALEESRRLKPEIPLVGLDGIPLRDEIELEVILT